MNEYNKTQWDTSELAGALSAAAGALEQAAFALTCLTGDPDTDKIGVALADVAARADDAVWALQHGKLSVDADESLSLMCAIHAAQAAARAAIAIKQLTYAAARLSGDYRAPAELLEPLVEASERLKQYENALYERSRQNAHTAI